MSALGSLRSTAEGLDRRRTAWARRQADRIAGDRYAVTHSVTDPTPGAVWAVDVQASNNGRLLIMFRLAGAVLVGLANVSKAPSMRDGRRFAVAETLTAAGCVGANLWLLDQVRSSRRSADRQKLDRALIVDSAAAMALNLATAVASPRGALGHGSAATFHTAVGGPFVWSSMHSIGAGLAVTAEGLVALMLMGRLNRARIQTDAGLNPLWGLVGTVFVGHTSALLTALVDTIETARHEQALAIERVRAADWVHDHTIQALALLLEDDDTPAPIRHVLRREHDRLRDWHQHAADAAPDGDHVALHDLILSQSVDVQTATFRIDVSCDPIAVPVVAGTALAGAVRETLSNARAHSGSDRALVSATTTDGMVVVTVRDYGRGFDVEEAAHRRPDNGLVRSVTGRLRAVDGSVQILRRDPGTEVRLSIPLSQGTVT